MADTTSAPDYPDLNNQGQANGSSIKDTVTNCEVGADCKLADNGSRIRLRPGDVRRKEGACSHLGSHCYAMKGRDTCRAQQ